jgi:hypothetical protein
MLSNDCLGTQEPHTFCKTTEILEHSHPQEVTPDKTAAGSTLISHQNGKVCIVSSLIHLARFISIFPTFSLLCSLYGQSSSTKDNLSSML